MALIAFLTTTADVFNNARDSSDEPQTVPSPLRGHWSVSAAPAGRTEPPGVSPGPLEFTEGMVSLGDGSLLRVTRYMDTEGPVERETWLAVTERETQGQAMELCGRLPIGFVVTKTSGIGTPSGQVLEVTLYAGRLDRLLSATPPPPCAVGFYTR